MNAQLRSQVLFHLTGRAGTSGANAGAVPAGLWPALMAPYRGLADLRHDFPIVLADDPDACVVPLVAAVDRALRAVAPPGSAGERVRKLALGEERRLRRAVFAGTSGTLRELWAGAATDADEAELTRVRDALPVDGELAGCDVDLPARFIEHAWRIEQRAKARTARARIDALVMRLDAILRADDARSPEAFTPPRLQATFGEAHQGLFDFAAMSRLMGRPRPRGGLPLARRQRIERVLAVLRDQALFPADGECGGVCQGIGEALDAFLERLPAMVELQIARQTGELEADGLYVEAVHDAYFAALDERSLAPEDLNFFPDVLVCVPSREGSSSSALLEALSSGIPLKVLVQFDDVLERPAPGGRRLGFGAHEAQLGTTTIGLGDVFVLQTVASSLPRQLAQVRRGLHRAGPALFCVYAGPGDDGSVVPPYLACAAALQSRAFPAFCFDPDAGPDLAARFALLDDPQPAADWPRETLTYADAELQSVTETVPFTFLDFALCDARHAAHFSVTPRANWNDGMLPGAEWLAQPPADVSRTLPYVLAVDEAGVLCRIVVDDHLVRAALRCRDQWRRLQELAGVRDSRTERALARERAEWEARLARELASVQQAAATTETVAAPAPIDASTPSTIAVETTPEPARDPAEPYVETLRCSSCNECTLAFPQLFAYNEDKQAYLKDAKAATYRQLVEAAESCQVSVIHPGQPRDPNEPGLEELIERARPFH